MKKRILFLVDKLVPAGTQTNLLRIVRHLDREKFEPYVMALLEGGSLEKEFREAGVEPVVLKTGRIYSLSGWKTYRFLVEWLRDHQIDIIQTHFLHADILGIAAGRKAGVKRIIAARRDEGFWRNGRQLMINRFLSRRTSRILANSQAVARAVTEKEKVSSEKIDVIYNGIEPGLLSQDLREATRNDLGLKKSDVAVGVVANMRHAIKGHIYVLEALAEVLKKNGSVKLVLAGDGPLRRELEDYAKALRIQDSVLFLGSRRDVPAILNAIDIGCLPSVTEGFSNSVLEYMAYEKPVVATAVGGNPESVNAESGFLVPARNAHALAEKILILAEDKELREKMGKAARRRVEDQFSVQRMIKNYQAYYSGQTFSPEKTKRRICHLIWALEPGGAERQVVTIAKWQKQNGDEPRVVCLTRKGKLAEELEESGIPVDLIQKKTGADFSIIGKLARFFKENSIHLVHTHVPTANLWGRLAARKIGVPVIVSEHSDMAATNFKFKMINRWLNPATAAYLVVSQHIKDLMVMNGVSADKIRVIRNGIPIGAMPEEATRQAIRKTFGLTANTPLIGTVGRLEERKDHSMLLRACALIQKEVPEARFILVGDGPLRKSLEEEAGRLNLTKAVIFTGVRQDIAALLAAMDIFVLSSITEGISISLLEAMAAGKPCVVTRVGGNPEVITDQVTGRLVPAQNAENLSEAVTALLKNPKRTSEMAVAGRLHVLSHFSQETMMRSIQEIYETLGGLSGSLPQADPIKKKVYTLAYEKTAEESR